MIQINAPRSTAARNSDCWPPAIWEYTMKSCLAAFAIAASLFTSNAQANDALEAKVRVYVPVYALAIACDIKATDAASGDHRVMLEGVKSDPVAKKLLARLHSETQAAYVKARNAGNRLGF